MKTPIPPIRARSPERTTEEIGVSEAIELLIRAGVSRAEANSIVTAAREEFARRP